MVLGACLRREWHLPQHVHEICHDGNEIPLSTYSKTLLSSCRVPTASKQSRALPKRYPYRQSSPPESMVSSCQVQRSENKPAPTPIGPYLTTNTPSMGPRLCHPRSPGHVRRIIHRHMKLSHILSSHPPFTPTPSQFSTYLSHQFHVRAQLRNNRLDFRMLSQFGGPVGCDLEAEEP